MTRSTIALALCCMLMGAGHAVAQSKQSPPLYSVNPSSSDDSTRIATTHWVRGIGGGTGTVTSVGLSVPGSSIFGVTGSPVSISGTLGLTTTGTSGGIPYFSSGSALSSSGALTANLPVFGGGAGVAPFVGTRSGNTTQVVTTTGTQTSGDCVKIDASGNHIANGSACGGGSVSVTAGTSNVVITPSPGTGTFTVGTTNAINTQSGTGAYALVAGDAAKQILRTNASGGADTIANATGSLGAGYSTTYTTTGFAGNTITPTTATINGLSVIKLGSYQYASIDSDGTNYHAALGLPQPATQTGTTFLRDDMTWASAAQLSVNQSWTAGQAVTPDTATQCGTQSAAGTMTPNFAISNSCVATFGAGNLTVANPTNVKAGQSWILSLTQDSGGSRTVTWGSQYKWASGTAPTLSTTASAKDVISCFSDTTTTHNCTLAVKGAS